VGKSTNFHRGVTGSAVFPISMIGKDVLPTKGPVKRSFARIFQPLEVDEWLQWSTGLRHSRALNANAPELRKAGELGHFLVMRV
jgi:hypothetical protein